MRFFQRGNGAFRLKKSNSEAENPSAEPLDESQSVSLDEEVSAELDIAESQDISDLPLDEHQDASLDVDDNVQVGPDGTDDIPTMVIDDDVEGPLDDEASGDVDASGVEALHVLSQDGEQDSTFDDEAYAELDAPEIEDHSVVPLDDGQEVFLDEEVLAELDPPRVEDYSGAVIDEDPELPISEDVSVELEAAETPPDDEEYLSEVDAPAVEQGEAHAPARMFLAQVKQMLGPKFALLSFRRSRSEIADSESADEVDTGHNFVSDLPTQHWYSLNTATLSEKWWSPKAILGAIEDTVRRRTLTLTVESGVIRVVVFQGNQAIAWGTAHPFEDDLTGTELGTFDEGYADRVYSLLMDMNFRRLRLVTELPLYTPLIRRLTLPNIRQQYFNSVVSSEVLETIPFSDEEVDVVWQHRGDKTGHDVLAVVVPKSGIDDHVKTLRRSKFTPSAIFPKAVGLAAAVGISDAIIVYASVPQAAVILVRDRLPTVVLQVDLQEGYWQFREHARLLSQGVEQVAGYQSTLEVEPEIDLNLPVVLVGPIATEDELVEAFRMVSKRDLLPFEPDIEHPEYFSTCEYAANIGLMLADRMKSKSGGKIRGENLPSVNLISARHLPKPLPFKPVAIYMSIAIFAAVAFNMTPKVDSIALEASGLEQRVENLEKRVRELRLNQAQLDNLQERIDASNLMKDQLHNKLDLMHSDVDNLLARVKAITDDARPFGLAVSSLSLEGEDLSIFGTALTNESIIEYTANLRDMGPEVFTAIWVERISSTSSGTFGMSDTDLIFQVKATLPHSRNGSGEEDEE